MTDKELLELAAHVCGYELAGYDGKVSDWLRYISDIGAIKYWNPLEDDGDALRLAVKLRIRFEIHHSEKFVAAFHNDLFKKIEEEAVNLNIYAATRRAIVRAAAEIGIGSDV